MTQVVRITTERKKEVRQNIPPIEVLALIS
jgi:hypothetical protein